MLSIRGIIYNTGNCFTTYASGKPTASVLQQAVCITESSKWLTTTVYLQYVHYSYKVLLYQFPRFVIIKYHKLVSIKEQKFIIAQLWRLEIQNQGVNRAMFYLKSLRHDCPRTLPASGSLISFLVYYSITTAPLLHLHFTQSSSLCVCLHTAFFQLCMFSLQGYQL